MERDEAAREVTLAVACSWIGLDGGRDLVGLCPPSESLPWLLGGVGGKCKFTAEWERRNKNKGFDHKRPSQVFSENYHPL